MPSDLTFVLTRTPASEFFFNNSGRQDVNEDENVSDEDRMRLYRRPRTTNDQPPDVRHYSGRYGTLGVIKGPKISSVEFVDTIPPGVRTPTDTTQYLSFADRTLKVSTDGRVVDSTDEYTTIERHRTDTGAMGFIRLHAAPDKAYRIFKGSNYDKLIEMRANSHGDYIRIVEDIPDAVLNTYSDLHKQILEKERAILIHEAVNVTWLTGCISPRPKGNTGAFDKDDDNNPSARTMRTLFAALKATSRGEGSLFVLD